MEEIINRLSEEPMFAGIALVLLVAAFFFVARKLVTLALVFAVGFFAIVGYFAFTGEEPPEGLERITEKAREKALKAKEKLGEASKKVGEELKEAAKSGVEEALED